MNPKTPRPCGDRHGDAVVRQPFGVVAIASFVWRSVQRLFERPAVSQTITKRGEADSSACSPFGDCERVAIERQFRVSPCITGLHALGSPTTIPRRVWPIVVDTVKRVTTRWFWPHVAVKGREILPPFVAHPYASLAVVCVPLRLPVVASVSRRLPDCVFRGCREAVPGNRALPEASTTQRVACAHRVTGYARLVSARASATPHTFAALVPVLFNDGELSVCMT